MIIPYDVDASRNVFPYLTIKETGALHQTSRSMRHMSETYLQERAARFNQIFQQAARTRGISYIPPDHQLRALYHWFIRKAAIYGFTGPDLLRYYRTPVPNQNDNFNNSLNDNLLVRYVASQMGIPYRQEVEFCMGGSKRSLLNFSNVTELVHQKSTHKPRRDEVSPLILVSYIGLGLLSTFRLAQKNLPGECTALDEAFFGESSADFSKRLFTTLCCTWIDAALLKSHFPQLERAHLLNAGLLVLAGLNFQTLYYTQWLAIATIATLAFHLTAPAFIDLCYETAAMLQAPQACIISQSSDESIYFKEIVQNLVSGLGNFPQRCVRSLSASIRLFDELPGPRFLFGQNELTSRVQQLRSDLIPEEGFFSFTA